MKRILLCIFMGCALIGLTGCGNEPVQEAEQNLQETQKQYGIVEKETVDELVAKFNTEVMDNSSLNPVSNDYFTVDKVVNMKMRLWNMLDI